MTTPGCPSKKRTFSTKRFAKNTAKRAKARGGVRLWVYPCPWCSGWHLTSKKPYNTRATLEVKPAVTVESWSEDVVSVIFGTCH